MSRARGVVPYEGECEECGKEMSRPLPRSHIGNVYQAIRVECRACETVNELEAGTGDDL